MTDAAETLDPGAARATRATPQYDAGKKHILERFTAAETLERYLHTGAYVGQTRCSRAVTA